jgi:hypothetical protein
MASAVGLLGAQHLRPDPATARVSATVPRMSLFRSTKGCFELAALPVPTPEIRYKVWNTTTTSNFAGTIALCAE